MDGWARRGERRRRPAPIPAIVQRFSFEAFGVPLTVEVGGAASPSLMRAVRAVLPPARLALISPSRAIATVAITAFDGGFQVRGADHVGRSFALEHEAVHAFDADLRAILALAAPNHVFIHAGVVRGAAGAIVVPGRSFSGKTTLIGALVRAGASYLSDEYAVLESSGAVWPYARSLSYRSSDGTRTYVPPAALGMQAPHQAVPVALVVTTTYRFGARWRPVERPSADTALTLIDNAVGARVRPDDVVQAAAAVARSARHLHGDRGDAADVASRLLALVGGPAPLDDPPSGPAPSTTSAGAPKGSHLGVVPAAGALGPG